MENRYFKEFGIKLIETNDLEIKMLEEIQMELRTIDSFKYSDHLIMLSEVIKRYNNAPIMNQEIESKLKGCYGSDE